MSLHLLTRRAAPSLAALVVLAAVVGCNADGAAGPADAPPTPVAAREVVSPDVPAPVLLRKHALTSNRTVSMTVDQNGGTFIVPGAGLTVVVPQGAVDGPITLTATALKGRLTAYEFGPHGTRFNVPLQMYQGLADAAIAPGMDLSRFEVGYFTDGAKLDARTNQASISEFIPTAASGGTVHFQVSHFSGYVIATGRGGKG